MYLLNSCAYSLLHEHTQYRKTLDDIEMPNGDDNSSSNDDAKYELLQKRDQDMSAFMDNFDASRDEVLVQTKTTKDVSIANIYIYVINL